MTNRPTNQATLNLQKRLRHILWLGGSPCAGKTTITKLLVQQYNLLSYHVDEAFAEHRKQVTIKEQPLLYKWTHTPWNELWMRPLEILLPEAIACYSEHFELIAQDLLILSNTESVPKPILVEGTSLLPNLVGPLLSSPKQGLWIVPTEIFQRQTYRRRGGWVETILKECIDPDKAFQNWMDRDVALWAVGT